MDAEQKVLALEVFCDALEILIERYGANATLQELKIGLHGQRMHLRGERVTISEQARKIGVHKSTLSNIVHRREYLTLEPDPDDDRRKFIVVDDLELRTRYLEDIVDLIHR